MSAALDEESEQSRRSPCDVEPIFLVISSQRVS